MTTPSVLRAHTTATNFTVSMAQRVVSGSTFKESWVELDAEIAQAEADWAATRRSFQASPVATSASGNETSESESLSRLEL